MNLQFNSMHLSPIGSRCSRFQQCGRSGSCTMTSKFLLCSLSIFMPSGHAVLVELGCLSRIHLPFDRSASSMSTEQSGRPRGEEMEMFLEGFTTRWDDMALPTNDDGDDDDDSQEEEDESPTTVNSLLDMNILSSKSPERHGKSNVYQVDHPHPMYLCAGISL
mmetsp:Transcript_58345/g.87970  ORF Transcript_58345/g.87970 Transcript_58345/m.87970 type:complete len:163 (+) Transcript_58345:71-559(+)